MNNKKLTRFNITVKGREYKAKDGNMKSIWSDIGKLTVFSSDPLPQDVSMSLEINHMPNAVINAFEIKNKNINEPTNIGLSL